MSFSDDFVGTAGDTLESRTGWTRVDGAAGAAQINASNQLKGTSGTNTAYTCTSQGSADHDTSYVVSKFDGGGFVCVRLTNANNFIGARCGGTTILELYKRNAGSFTFLGSHNGGYAVTDTIDVVASGNNLSVTVNAGGKVGISAVTDSFNNTVQTQGIVVRIIQDPILDTFVATAAGGGGGATTYTKTVSLDAVVKKQNILLTASLDGIVKKTQSLQVSLDAILRKNGITVTTNLDGVVKKAGITKTTSLDAAIKATLQLTASLDAVITSGGTHTLTASLDAVIKKTLALAMSMDAILRKTATKTLSLDGYLILHQLLTTSLDASLSKAGITLATSMDAVLQGVGWSGASDSAGSWAAASDDSGSWTQKDDGTTTWN